MHRRTAVLSFLCVLFLLLGGFPAAGQPAPLTGFDDYVHTALRDWDVPGLAVSVVKDGKVVFSKGYGVRKVGEPAPGADGRARSRSALIRGAFENRFHP